MIIKHWSLSLLTFLDLDLHPPSSKIFRDAAAAALWGIFLPENCVLSGILWLYLLCEVEQSSSNFGSASIDMATLTRCLAEIELSTVTSSDLWGGSLHDLYPSVFPFRDVVADSELPSGRMKGLWTSTDLATLSLLKASMSCEHSTNSRCKCPQYK